MLTQAHTFSGDFKETNPLIILYIAENPGYKYHFIQ
jgi:hypothetical protein